MNIPVSKIIRDKLHQLETDGTIKQKIEDAVEKAVVSAIISEIESYTFKNSISNQVKKSLGVIAADCGISAYNGFISEKVKAVIQNLYTNEVADKVEKVMQGVVLKKYDTIKLSEIFQKYREYLKEHIDQDEKEEYRAYTARIESDDDGSFTKYTIILSRKNDVSRDDADVRVCFYRYNRSDRTKIWRLFLDGNELHKATRITFLNDFEALLVNLYYNGTEVIMDVDDVDLDTEYDVYEDY